MTILCMDFFFVCFLTQTVCRKNKSLYIYFVHINIWKHNTLYVYNICAYFFFLLVSATIYDRYVYIIIHIYIYTYIHIYQMKSTFRPYKNLSSYLRAHHVHQSLHGCQHLIIQRIHIVFVAAKIKRKFEEKSSKGRTKHHKIYWFSRAKRSIKAIKMVNWNKVYFYGRWCFRCSFF